MFAIIRVNSLVQVLCLLPSTAFRFRLLCTIILSFENSRCSLFANFYLFNEIIRLDLVWGLKNILKPIIFFSFHSIENFASLFCAFQPFFMFLRYFIWIIPYYTAKRDIISNIDAQSKESFTSFGHKSEGSLDSLGKVDHNYDL